MEQYDLVLFPCIFYFFSIKYILLLFFFLVSEIKMIKVCIQNEQTEMGIIGKQSEIVQQLGLEDGLIG